MCSTVFPIDISVVTAKRSGSSYAPKPPTVQYHVVMDSRPKSHRLRCLLCIVLVAITLPTCFIVFAYGDEDNYEVRLAGGAVGISWGELPGHPIRPTSYTYGFDYWPVDGVGLLPLPLVGGVGSMRWAYIPFWPVTAFVIVWTVVPWWRTRRRRRLGLCPQCGYNLTGNVSGRCPECGVEVRNVSSS